MKRGKPLTRRTKLGKGRKALKRSRSLLAHRRKPGDRQSKAWTRAFHSPAFVSWIHTLPCVRCQALGLAQTTESEPHHEPPRGRSSWKSVSPLCQSCHTSGPGARHGPNSGVATFWTFGITYEAANRRTHYDWLAYSADIA